MDKLAELMEKRGHAVKVARELIDKCDAEKRAMNADETGKYEAAMSDFDTLDGQIKQEQRVKNSEKEIEAPFNPAKQEFKSDAEKAAIEQRAAFNKYLRSGSRMLNEAEHRALSAGVDTDGGYLVAPQAFIATLLKAVDDLVAIRGLATIIPLAKAESLGVPTMDTDVSDADWTPELSTGSLDDSLKFGKREMLPHAFAKRVKISNKLLRQSTIDVEALVRGRLAYKFGVTEEKAFMTGDGVEKPLGIFTLSNDGIRADRDVAGNNTATAIKADTLIDVKTSLKAPYLASTSCKWLFHRTVLGEIRKLKDGNGQYIWQPGLSGAIPDRILEIPYVTSEYAPNTMTTGKYVGILGDFKNYWIADALSIQIQRLVELYAETNQVGFIGRAEVDGAPVMSEAFARIKLA